MQENRVELELCLAYRFAYKDGECKYDLKTDVIDSYDIDELKRMQTWGRGRTAKMLDETLEIMKLTHRCLHKASLLISYNIDGYPEEALVRMLTFYRNTDFSSINIWSTHLLVENFLIHQLQTKTSLKEVCLLPFQGHLSDEVRLETEDFALTKNFTFLKTGSEAIVFSRTFFERKERSHGKRFQGQKIPTVTTAAFC